MHSIFDNTSYFFNLFALPHLFTAIAFFVAGVAVYLLDKRSLLNFMFMCISLSCGVWQLGFSLAFFSVYEDAAFFWIKFSYSGIVFVAAHIYAFSVIYLRIKGQRKYIFIIYLSSLIFLALINSNYFLAKPNVFFWGYHITAGHLYASFLFIFFVVSLTSLVNFYYGSKQEKFSSERKRIRLLFFAFTIAILGAVDFLSGYRLEIYPFGYILLIICLGIVAYTILKYKALTPVVAAETIVATMGDCLILIAADLSIRSINEATVKLLGYKRNELIGQAVSKVFVEDRIFKGDKWQYLLKYGVVRDDNMYFLAKDASQIPISFSASIIRDRGEIVGIVGIAKDVREMIAYIKNLDRAYKQLKETQDKLVRSERLAIIGELAAVISHELRNPLGVIRNAIYFLKNKISPEEYKLREYVEMIEKEISRSDKIIGDLLTFSRIAKPVLKPININTVVEDALRTLSIYEDDAKITKIIELEKNLPLVSGDTDQLRQVFINLTTNAIQAMPDGGTLRINTQVVDKFIEVRFVDSGVGISRENINKVFDPFFTTRPSGIGLGLAVCHRIITDHRGVIDVKTQIDQGTEFIIKLPVVETK